MKDYRPFVFLGLILISSILFLFPLIVKTGGVIVTYVGANSACKDVISLGSYITEITGKPTKNMNDFNEITKNLDGPITLIIDNNPRSCTIPEDSSLDVKVRNIESAGLKTSIEIGGGTYFIFEPEEEVSENVLQNILDVIKSRVRSYNLINTIIDTENESVYIISSPQENNYVDLLTEPGVLEGKIMETVYFTDKKSEFTLNDSLYEVVLGDNSITINGSKYKKDQYFILNDLSLKVENVSENTSTLSIHVFNNKDLTLSEDAASSSRILKQGGGYVLVLPVVLSKDSSESFAKATAGQEITINPTTGEGLLKNPLLIFIDEEAFINLPVGAIDVGKPISQLVLWKYSSSEEEASNDLIRLKSVIEFKNLPTNLLLIESGDYKSPSGGFYSSLFLYGVITLTVVFGSLFFVRYKKRGIIVLPLLSMILAEMLFVVGITEMSWLSLLLFFVCTIFLVLNGEINNWFGWASLLLMFVLSIGISMTNVILDSYSIVGMLAIVLFSLIVGTLIGDKPLAKKDVHIIGQYKKSLKLFWKVCFITTVFLVVLFFSFDKLRTFSTVVYVGVISFVALTIPIYFSLIEKLTKKF